MARDSTRERILAAALAEFDEKGYEAATVAAICARAGASNGSFFHAFRAKQDVAGAVFLAALGAYHEALIAAAAKNASAARGVAALVAAHVRWVTKNRPMSRFMFLHAPHAGAPGIRARQAAANERFRARLSAWYGPNFERGALRAVPPEVLISQIIGPAQMFCRAWLSGRSPERPDAHLPSLIACAIRAVVSAGGTAGARTRRATSAPP